MNYSFGILGEQNSVQGGNDDTGIANLFASMIKQVT